LRKCISELPVSVISPIYRGVSGNILVGRRFLEVSQTAVGAGVVTGLVQVDVNPGVAERLDGAPITDGHAARHADGGLLFDEVDGELLVHQFVAAQGVEARLSVVVSGPVYTSMCYFFFFRNKRLHFLRVSSNRQRFHDLIDSASQRRANTLDIAKSRHN